MPIGPASGERRREFLSFFQGLKNGSKIHLLPSKQLLSPTHRLVRASRLFETLELGLINYRSSGVNNEENLLWARRRHRRTKVHRLMELPLPYLMPFKGIFSNTNVFRILEHLSLYTFIRLLNIIYF